MFKNWSHFSKPHDAARLTSLSFNPLSGLLLGHSTIRVVNGGALLSCHATFSLSQLAFTCQQFLSLLVDLTLHLDLDFPKLLFLATQLLLLKTYRLGGQIVRVQRGVTGVYISCLPSFDQAE